VVEQPVEQTKFTDYSFDYFDTVTTIVGYEDTKEEFDAACRQIKAELEVYHKLYTIYNRYEGMNNLCLINREGMNAPMSVDGRLLDMLGYAKEMYTATGGHMNVAMGSVLALWHQYRDEGMKSPEKAALPPMADLQAAAAHTSIDSLVLDTEQNTVFLADPALRLDVGAVAKGYAVEMTAQWMQKQGLTGYILNVGGNVRILGPQPEGKKWTVGIENPNTADEETPYVAYLELDSLSLVTSGSYQRYYMVEGKSYHHIIDKDTLMPGENFLSVSVLCPHSGQADAFSTALFTMPYEEGAALVAATEGMEAMWVLPDGEIRYSAGFQAYCRK
jgi:thiamine biosynthesis lipoprotein